ncbi:unnamed protein product [Arctia plantaginis]|uniref:CCHC-type domain-containing protein n=1 Tax=Arctia plantaginis TaxID=874455 RepID=A0A8S0YZ84_ARCPL|nr:unnamed protein product [Arctia plantaginis]
MGHGHSGTTYNERMGQYLLVNNVKSELQVPTLIACVGYETYELMVDLSNPKKPTPDYKYEELVELMRKQLQPTPSILAERFKFRNRSQTRDEAVAQFAVVLKHLARNCQFKINLFENLRDQFVCGLLSETTRQRLLCDDENLTFTKAYSKAVALESAANDAATVERSCNKELYAVHAIQTNGRRAGWQGVAGASSKAAGRNGAGVAPPPTVPRRTFSNSSITCNCCGERGRVRNNCKFYKYVCKICLKSGHLKKVCPSVRQQREETRVMRLEADRNSSGEEMEWPQVESDGEGEGPSGRYMLELSSGSEPVLADLHVAGCRLRMHVDTGSPISCISEVLYLQEFKGIPVIQDNLQLKGYDGQVIKSLGYIVVNVQYSGKEEVLKLYIIRQGGVPLRGREWLKCLKQTIVRNACVYFFNTLQCTFVHWRT